jgi:PleD family two-component response regulator
MDADHLEKQMSENSRQRILDVGQCNMDHGNISRMLKQHFDAIVDRAKSIDQVMYMTGFYDYDLVLVNRVFDEDGAEGLELIRRLKAHPELSSVPVMLVSNFDDAQQSACDAGALPGFGKSELDAPQTIERLSACLGHPQ